MRNIYKLFLFILLISFLHSPVVKADYVIASPPFKFHKYSGGFLGIGGRWNAYDIDGLITNGEPFHFRSTISRELISFKGGGKCRIKPPKGSQFFKYSSQGYSYFTIKSGKDYVSFNCQQ